MSTQCQLLGNKYSEFHLLIHSLQTSYPPNDPLDLPFPLSFFFFTFPQAYYSLFANWMLFFIFILSPPNVQIYLNHPQTESYKI